MSEFLALHYESKYDFLLHLYIFDVVTDYKKTLFGRFLNSKKYKILRTYRNKHLNIESKRNKHFIKLIIHKEVLKLQNCEIAILWLHFWETRSMKTPLYKWPLISHIMTWDRYEFITRCLYLANVPLHVQNNTSPNLYKVCWMIDEVRSQFRSMWSPNQ
jgi:hypothetical protein